MKLGVLFKLAAVILLVVAAILFFVETGGVVAYGLGALGLACFAAADLKL